MYEFENSFINLNPRTTLRTGKIMFAAPPIAIDPVVAGMLRIYAGTAVVAGLPLAVPDDSDLQKGVHVLLQWNNLRQE